MNQKQSVAIVNYGVGNLFNICSAFERLHIDAQLTDDPAVLAAAEKIVLPGVGAFAAGMEGLTARGLIKPLHDAAARGAQILGICLGMQLLMSQSEEHGIWQGLNLIPGRVVRLSKGSAEKTVKIPHMGWNTLEPAGATWNDTILDTIAPESSMYFVHSYHVVPENPTHILAQTEYGENIFCAAVRAGNISGCQFHPERSAELGLQILANFGGASPLFPQVPTDR